MTYSKTYVLTTVCLVVVLSTAPAVAGPKGSMGLKSSAMSHSPTMSASSNSVKTFQYRGSLATTLHQPNKIQMGTPSLLSRKHNSLSTMIAPTGTSIGKNGALKHYKVGQINTVKKLAGANDPGKGKGLIPIDPGKGNGKSGKCYPKCPPYNKNCGKNYCGNFWPFGFPYPWWGGYNGGFCGGSSVFCSPVSQGVAYDPIVAMPLVQSANPVDLELVEVRQLDSGVDGDGPAYRVAFRNKNGAAIDQPFDVALAATVGRQLTRDAAIGTTRVEGIEAGQTLAVDVRLPAKALNMGLNSAGQPVGFGWLTAVVDSHREIEESSRDNDYATMNRSEIVMVAQQ